MSKHFIEDNWRTPIQKMEIGDKIITKSRTITKTDIELGALLGGDLRPTIFERKGCAR